jgi:uncharacterized protein YbjT (DUF2867 family)
MKVLVTGGTGVIGEGVIPALLKAGHEVRLLTRGAEKASREWPDGVEPFAADIGDGESLEGAAADCEAIVHIAGIVEESPPDVTFERINVGGTRNIVTEAERAGVARFIFVSSLGADRGSSQYHRSKLSGEEIVRGFRGDWLIIRPGGVYGPGDEIFSTLMKMIRTLPAVPIIDGGDQRFQFIWYEDLGAAIAQSLDMPEIYNQTLEVAGAEISTTNEIVDKLSQITGRSVARIPVPSFLASFGSQIASLIGVDIPINEEKLQMLREENFIRETDGNALTSVFNIKPLPLDEGLKLLADAMPEILPTEGVGSLKQKLFWADIEGSPYSAPELLETFRANLAEVMPIDFSTEPDAPQEVVEGATLTAALPLRGNIQIRVEEVTDHHITFATVEGHPLAGVVRFIADQRGEAIRFTVETLTRAANAFDLLAMNTIGGRMQDSNWEQVVERVVALSEGEAIGGVSSEQVTLDDESAGEIERWVEGLVARRKRKATAQKTGE